MKKLRLTLVLPLSIIALAVFRVRWYVKPFDARDSYLYGFPFPSLAEAWHTSGAYQVFLLEFILNFLFYVVCFRLMVALIERYLFRIQVPKFIPVVLWVISACILIFSSFLLIQSNNLYYLYRPFSMELVSVDLLGI